MSILSAFENIPGQLAKVDKRFALNSVREDAIYEVLGDDLAWLSRAGVALPAYLAAEPKLPLLRACARGKFKLYSSDCGLLLVRYPLAAAREGAPRKTPPERDRQARLRKAAAGRRRS